MSSMKCYTVHGKVGGIIQAFVIVNPANIVFNEAKVQGELEDGHGNKLLVTRTMLTFQNGMKIIAEETMEELLEIFQPVLEDGPADRSSETEEDLTDKEFGK